MTCVPMTPDDRLAWLAERWGPALAALAEHERREGLELRVELEAMRAERDALRADMLRIADALGRDAAASADDCVFEIRMLRYELASSGMPPEDRW